MVASRQQLGWTGISVRSTHVLTARSAGTPPVVRNMLSGLVGDQRFCARYYSVLTQIMHYDWTITRLIGTEVVPGYFRWFHHLPDGATSARSLVETAWFLHV